MPRYRFTHDVSVVFADETDESGKTLEPQPGDIVGTARKINHPYLTEVKAEQPAEVVTETEEEAEKPAKVTTEKEDQDRG